MKLNITQALNRLHWRFTTKASFKPKQEDVDAYNQIAVFCDRAVKKQMNETQLFAKLYIFLYGEFTQHYNCHPANPIVQKELHRILDTPLPMLVEMARVKMNMAVLDNHLKNEPKTLAGHKQLEYDDVAENLRALVNAAYNTFTTENT